MHMPGNDTWLDIGVYNTCNMWDSRAACALTLRLIGMLLLVFAVPLVQRLSRDIHFFKMGPPAYAQKVLARQSRPHPVYKSVRMLSYGSVTFVSSPVTLERIFTAGNTFSNRLGKSSGLRHLGMFEQGVIWNNNTEKWQRFRKYFAKAVQEGATQPKNLQANVDICRAAFETTQEQLISCSKVSPGTDDRSRIVDPLNFLRCCTLRITCAIAFGIPVCALSQEEVQNVVKSVNGYFRAWEYFLMRPGWLTMATGLMSTHKEHKQAVASLNKAVVDIIGKAETELTANPKDCFMTQILRDQRAGQFGEADLRQLVLEMIIAGTDTSSVTMFYMLKACQDDGMLEDNIATEVQDATGNEAVQPADFDKLKKLTAALYETMRFKPVGPVSIRQATQDFNIPPSEDSPSGLSLKKGDTVIAYLEGMHRNPDTFANPDTFDINHFLGSKACLANSPSFRPFGHGRKGCVGKQLAMVEMRVLMTCWFQAFSFDRTQDQSLADKTTASLRALQVRWHVANMPTTTTLFHILQKADPADRQVTTMQSNSIEPLAKETKQQVCIIGAHGVGKSTLVKALKTSCLRHFQVVGEQARKVLQSTKMTRGSFHRNEDFLLFQKLVLEAQLAAEADMTCSSLLMDRSVLDPLAYTAWRFGVPSQQVEMLLSLARESVTLKVCNSDNAWWFWWHLSLARIAWQKMMVCACLRVCMSCTWHTENY